MLKLMQQLYAAQTIILLFALSISIHARARETVGGNRNQYQYSTDLNLNQFIDKISGGKACPQPTVVELAHLKSTIKELGGSIPDHLPADLATAEKALFFQFGAKSAARAAKCRADHLQVLEQSTEYTKLESLAIENIARHLDELRKYDRLIYGEHGLKQFKAETIDQAKFDAIWNSLWMIEDPKMQAYVKNIMGSGISSADFRKFNRTPSSAQTKPDYLKIIGQTETDGADAMLRVTEEAARGELSYSFRKAAISAMAKEAKESSSQLTESARTGKFKSYSQEQIVQYSGALHDLQHQGFHEADALACRLQSEFVAGAKKAKDATSTAINGIGIVTAPVALLETTTVGAGIAGLRIVCAVLEIGGSTAAALNFMGRAVNDCGKSAPIISSCSKFEDWQSSQVSSAKSGNCAVDLALTAINTGASGFAIFKTATTGRQTVKAALDDVERTEARISLRSKGITEKNETSFFNKTNPVELTDKERLYLTERITGLHLSDSEAKRVLQLHNIGDGFGKYTPSQLREKAKGIQQLLASRGIKDPEQVLAIVDKLLRQGILGKIPLPERRGLMAWLADLLKGKNQTVSRGEVVEESEPASASVTSSAGLAKSKVGFGRMQDAINQAVKSGKLRVVRLEKGVSGPPTAVDIGPEIVPGRYYAVVKQPNGQLVIAEYDSLHGAHTALARATNIDQLRKLDRPGQAAGGFIFDGNGVSVSGKILRYPDSRNANELANDLNRMGIRVKFKTADSIVETNPPENIRSSGQIHLINIGP